MQNLKDFLLFMKKREDKSMMSSTGFRIEEI